jgi:uncharacterized alpha-E superfamily protein
MLSRVADALFWMSRYLERAEHIARLLDVSFHLELDLHGVAAGAREEETAALAAILNAPMRGESYEGDDSTSLHDWLTFDAENPNSIMACVNRARNNARSVRGAISPSIWRELNKLYWQLKDADFVARAQESPHDFYGAVETGCQLFQGLCDATLLHDEGWHFIRLGRFLERADLTLRILDVKYHQLHPRAEAAELPVLNLKWAAVLKSCLAFEAYQRLYISRVEPERVVEFLLLHAHFPHTVRFCLEEAARALTHLDGVPSEHNDRRVDRLLGQALSELRYLELDDVLQDGLHAFLTGAIQRCAQASAAIQEQYALNYNV